MKDEIKKNESRFMLFNNTKIKDLFYNNRNISQESKENDNKEFEKKLMIFQKTIKKNIYSY